MTTFEYTEVGGGGRLELELAPGASVDAVSWGMLAHNPIPGIARVSRSQLDDRVTLAFGVTGTALARTLDQQQRKDDVLWILDGMVEAVLAVERHMIPVESVVYDPEHVYVDAASKVVTMVCVPVEGVSHGDPVTFFKKVIFNVRYDQRDDTTYVSDLINVLGGSDARDLSRLSRLLRATRLTGDAAAHRQAPPAEPAPVHGVHVTPGSEVPSPAVPVRVADHPGAFSVPGGAAPAPSPRPAVTGVRKNEDDEEQITLFYLLQHYTKENKERYDRQRKARADAKDAADAVQAQAQAHAQAQAQHQAHALPPVPGAPVHENSPQHAHPGAGALGQYGADATGAGYGYPQAGTGAPATPAAGYPAPGVDPHGAVPAPPGAQQGMSVPGQPPGVETAHAPDPRYAGPPGQPLPPSPYVLFGLRDDATGVTTWLDKPITVVGRRRARVDIAISDDLVSKQHAILQVDAGVCSVIDNASTNGVEVDGEKIVPLEPRTLRQGSRVKIGEASFVVVEHRR
ncbi:FHA domain-containing protein [Sanguibacter sp. A247]|uniref:FHA domain-containing protein n=1 Tax=unclassified Sanguibacter TaxID=2645534 RepID=UPI003FD8759E